MGYGSSDHSWLSIHKVDAAFVFAIGDDRYSIDRLPLQRTKLHFQLQADVRIPIHQWLRLYTQSQILVVEGRKGSLKGIVLNHLRKGGRVEDRRKARVQDRISRARTKGSVVALRYP